MTDLELLQALGHISTEALSGAENLQLAPKKSRKKPLQRGLLIAALISLMLFLVSCAMAYMLHMQDLKIGERQTLRDVFDPFHREIVGTQTVSQQVLTLSGVEGSPAYQAAREWFSFQQSYDPDKSIRQDAFRNGDPEAQFPDTYWPYRTYSQEMVDELHRLSEKYNLTLLGSPMEFRSMSAFKRAVGIDHILTTKSKANLHLDSGTCYPGGNFELDCDLTLPEGKDTWPYTIHLILYYSRKDCLSAQFQYLDTAKQWNEWNYRTASGQEILILHAAEDSGAYLICDKGDCTMAFSFEAGYNPMTDDPNFVPEWMTDRQVEQVADAIDFSIRPQLPDASAANITGHPKDWEIETKAVYFDGAYGKLIFHLTAPRKIDLQMEKGADLYPDNMHTLSFSSPAGTIKVNNWTYYGQDDGNGKKNTADIVIEFGVENIDDPLFQSETTWHMHMEDLVSRRSNGRKEVEEIIAEGVWDPEFTFQNCDFRKIECLTAPIQIKERGTTFKLLSYELRNNCALITVEDNFNMPLSLGSFVILDDGTEIPLIIGDSRGNLARRAADSPIDLDHVAAIRFEDGKMISVHP